MLALESFSFPDKRAALFGVGGVFQKLDLESSGATFRAFPIPAINPYGVAVGGFVSLKATGLPRDLVKDRLGFPLMFIAAGRRDLLVNGDPVALFKNGTLFKGNLKIGTLKRLSENEVKHRGSSRGLGFAPG